MRTYWKYYVYVFSLVFTLVIGYCSISLLKDYVLLHDEKVYLLQGLKYGIPFLLGLGIGLERFFSIDSQVQFNINLKKLASVGGLFLILLFMPYLGLEFLHFKPELKFLWNNTFNSITTLMFGYFLMSSFINK